MDLNVTVIFSHSQTSKTFVDVVMIGREACSNPCLLAELEKQFFAPDPNLK